jgi:hypothetical protein
MNEEKTSFTEYHERDYDLLSHLTPSDWNLRREPVSYQPHSRSAAFQNLTGRIKPNVRRLAGIVTGICALYLTVGAVDAPCRDHSRDGSSGSSAVVMAHQNGTPHELPAQKGERPKPCKSAAIPCCVAMTSCGTTIALGASVSSAAFPIAAQIAPHFHLAQPLSRIAAPEPPPPKA